MPLWLASQVVRLLHLFRTTKQLVMVFEFMERSIMQMIADHPRGLPPAEVKRILWWVGPCITSVSC